MKKLILLACLAFSLNSIAAEAQHLRRARNVTLAVGTGGIYYGYGWLPYWGYTFGYPVVNFPVYGYAYWPYWNYLPRYSSFGAISFSPSSETSGVAWSYATQNQALSSAQAYCGNSDCQPVVWVQGGCAAISYSQETKRVGYGYHTYKYTAQSKAMRACHVSGARDCKVHSWVCSY